LSEAGIDLPFPTRVVLLHDQTEEADGDRSRQREGWPVPADGRVPRPRHLNNVTVERSEASDDDGESDERQEDRTNGGRSARR
jgi:small conductance mechanosensitive channel